MSDISQSVWDSAMENLVLTVLMNCTMMARARACTSVVRKPVEKLENGHLDFLAWAMLILNIDEMNILIYDIFIVRCKYVVRIFRRYFVH